MKRRFWQLLPLCVVVALAACARRAPEPVRTAAAEAPDAGVRTIDAATLGPRIDQALGLRSAGKRIEAIAMLEEVRADALAVKRPEIASLALNRRGDVANDLGRKDEARHDYELAFHECEQRGDFAGMGRAAHDRALVPADVWGAAEPEALAWYPKAIEARKKAGDLVGVRRSANNLAIQYFYGRQKDEALRWYGEALTAAEAASDWEGVYKVHANLALLRSVEAEGAFADASATLRAWVPPAKLDAAVEAMAREHFAKGIEAAGKIGRTEEDVCGVFGNYSARCFRLTPSNKGPEGMVAFFAQLALEAQASDDGDAQLQAGLLCLRAADAARAAKGELGKQAKVFEQTARADFDAAAKAAGDEATLCSANPRAAELCARLRPGLKKKAKPGKP